MKQSARYLFRLFVAFIYRFKGLLLICTILSALIFITIFILFPKIFDKKSERIGIIGRFYSDTLPPEVEILASRGLTKINEKYEVEPDIASGWESPDKGKTWTFKLKDNVYWQDGQALKSKDLVYKFSDVTIETPDDRTITFRLSDNYTPFPSVLSIPVFKKGYVGLGQWKIKNFNVSGNLIRSITLLNDKGDKKIFKLYPTEDRAKMAYKLGQLDIISGVFSPTPFENWNNSLVSNNIDKGKIVVLFFNTQDSLLSEKSIRQALSYAINKEKFNDSRSLGPISEISWVYNPQIKPYEYDQKKSKDIIDKLEGEQKENLNINIVTTPSLLEVAEDIVNDWQTVGVNSQLLVSSIIPTDYQAYLTIVEPPFDPDQYSLWHSSQERTNLSKYRNPRIDKLLEDGRRELNPEERRRIYLDFQRFLLEDSPAHFLYYPHRYEVIRK